MSTLLSIALVLGPTPLTGNGGAALPTAADHARPALIAEKTGATVGEPLWIGVTFEIDPKWHLYWDGQNDSGLPVTVKWTLPEGVTVGPLQWPTPERGIYPLEVIDYIYEKRVTAIAPLTISESAKASATAAGGAKGDGAKGITIAADLHWLVCSNICLPGNGHVTMDVAVVSSGAKDGPEAGKFAEARKRIPRALPADGGGLTHTWEGDTLLLSVKDAKGLVFYPDSKCAPLAAAIMQGETKTNKMRLDFTRVEGAIAQASGIVEVRREKPQASEYFTVVIPGPGKAPAEKGGVK